MNRRYGVYLKQLFLSSPPFNKSEEKCPFDYRLKVNWAAVQLLSDVPESGLADRGRRFSVPHKNPAAKVPHDSTNQESRTD